MQLDFFSLPPTPAVLPLRRTTLPDLNAMISKIGTPQEWNARTLGHVLGLWHQVYQEFISVLDEPIDYAKQWSKPGGKFFQQASYQARQHYNREFEMLTQARHELKRVSYRLYELRMDNLFAKANESILSQGLDELELEGADELVNEVFQRPVKGYLNLDKRLPDLLADLMDEYLNLPELSNHENN